MMLDAIGCAVESRNLDAATMEAAMEAFFTGEVTPVQMAGLLVALRMKGETAIEVAAAARVMRRHVVAVRVQSGGALLDTCGTGGSGADAFNISTVASLVLAACGVRVAKHGNRAASSKCGSADLLEALGVNLKLSPERIGASIDELGIGFMLATAHHPAMKHVVPVRGDLGIRTLFNFLGPLINPAGVTHQLLGVSDGSKLELLASVLNELGITAAWVVHGADGLDEISLHGETRVAEVAEGRVRMRTVTAAEFGLDAAPLSSLQGGGPDENAKIARAILAGGGGPKADAVVLNAAAALCVVGAESEPRRAAERARAALADGSAASKLDAWKAFA